MLRASIDMRLVDLTGPGLTGLGATAAAIHGNYAVTQAWSLGLWSHPDSPHGLLYQSRHDPSVECIALFDRVDVDLHASSTSPLAPPLLVPVLDRYGVALVP